MTLSSINADARTPHASTPSSFACARRALVSAFALLALAAAQDARADVSPSARTLARSLFEQARELLARNRFAEACPKLAESMRLDPAAGTQLNLAYCHEGEGKTATAWAEYNDALTQARRDGRPEREEFISARLRALSPRLVTLTVTLAPGADVPGLEVSIDDARVGSAALGVATPVDPGSHAVVAKASGFGPWTSQVTVGVGDGKRTVVVPRLAETQTGASGTGTPPVAKAAEKSRSTTHQSVVDSPVERPTDGRSSRGTWGYALLGTGLLSVGVGVAFGMDAIVKWHDRNADCMHGCNATGVQAGNAAETSAWVSDFTVGVGIAAAAVGTCLLLVPGAYPVQTGSRARVRVIPIVSGREIGLGFAGVIQ